MDKQGITYQMPQYLKEGTDKAYILVVKNKEGPVGHFTLDWTPGFTRFADPNLTGYGMDALFEGMEELYSNKNEESW